VREILFRARWKCDKEVIEDFMEARTLGSLNADHLIVEQYTGLTDKNGVKIWEGDYILFGKLKYRIEYIEGFMTYCVFTDQEWGWYKDGSNHFKYCYQEDNEKRYFLHEFDSYEVEVVGNVFEEDTE
jgi:uncharacterized phage protein (TIGR01671 family)